MPNKLESAIGELERILAEDDEEEVALMLMVGLGGYGFNVNAITNPKLVSLSYRTEKYEVAIDTERRVIVSSFNASNDKNGEGGGGNN